MCEQVHERANSFRAQIGSLDIICRLYNSIYKTLLPVEKPLIQGKLDALGSALHKGLTVRSLPALLDMPSLNTGHFFFSTVVGWHTAYCHSTG